MTDYRMTCRHCGGRFLEMANLLFHRCSGQSDAQNRPRSRAKRPVRGKVATGTQRLSGARAHG
jgi:hypothetical protein